MYPWALIKHSCTTVYSDFINFALQTYYILREKVHRFRQYRSSKNNLSIPLLYPNREKLYFELTYKIKI